MEVRLAEATLHTTSLSHIVSNRMVNQAGLVPPLDLVVLHPSNSILPIGKVSFSQPAPSEMSMIFSLSLITRL
jgi:hypothetical protein